MTPVNDPPTAVNDATTVAQNSSGNAISVLSNDSAAPDQGETLTVVAVTTPAHGAVAITGGGTGVSYTPAAAYVGSDTFSYTISDGNGGTASATVTVTVVMMNTAPVNTLTTPADMATPPVDAGGGG